MRTSNQTLSFIAAVVTTGALLAGCGATIKQAEQMDPRVEAAQKAFGTAFDYMIVEPDSKVADAMFVGFFGGPLKSDLSRELFIRIAQAEGQGKPFMVTGSRAEKTAFVIIQALDRSPDNALPNLELLYLGEEQYIPGIEAAVNRVGGTLRFAPYPG